MRCQRQHSAIHAGKWGIAGQPEPAACSRCAPFYGGHQSEGCPATGPSKQRLPGSRSTNVTILGTSLSCLPPPVQKSKHSIPADGRPLVLTVSHWDLPWFRQQWHSTAQHRIAHIAAFDSGFLFFVSSSWVLTGGWALLSVLSPKVLHWHLHWHSPSLGRSQHVSETSNGILASCIVHPAPCLPRQRTSKQRP